MTNRLPISKVQSIVVATLNCRSIRNKYEKISDIVLSHNLDVVALTETWLIDSDFGVAKAALPWSYNLFSLPRADGVPGGGVAFLVRNSLKVKVVKKISKKCLELLEIFLQVQQDVLHLAVVYRPPTCGVDAVFFDEFSIFCDTFSVKTGKLLLCGDFNFWIDDPSSKPGTSLFLDLLADHGLKNHVASATHIAGHVLDLVVALDQDEENSYIMDLSVQFIDNNSDNINNKLDHALIKFRVVFPRPDKVKRTFSFRKYHLLNIVEFNRYLRETLARPILHSFSGEQLVQCYRASIKFCLDSDCPVITATELVRDECPWYDGRINQLRQARRKAEKVWLQLRTPESRSAFCQARNNVTNGIKSRKVEYYKDRVEQCGTDQRKLYRVVHELLGSKKKKQVPHGRTEEALSEGFSNFYDEKVRLLRSNIPYVPFSEKYFFAVNYVNTLSKFEFVSRESVHSVIKSSNKTYCGLDPIDIKRVPDALDVISDFQHCIINRCFEEGKFPDSEKIAIISPELKKSGLDTDLFPSYRPVSHPSFSSKNIERLILEQLIPLLRSNNILPSVQSGYRTHHSTETALCKIYNDLIINSCEGKQSILVLLDLSSAFDTVDHSILLDDLYRCGLRDSALELLRSYLTDRYQEVRIGNARSSPKRMEWGVPQGSVLGPVLFSIYISPIINILVSHGIDYHFYADDMQIYFKFTSDDNFDEKVKTIMVDIVEFLNFRRLKLNESKTEIIMIKGNRRAGIIDEHIFDILGNQIKSKKVVKNLGVSFDSDLSFASQISTVAKKCGYNIRNLYAIKKFINRDLLIILVNAQILSRVDFCNALYFGQPSYLRTRLQSVINRAARLVCGLPPRAPTSAAIRSIHWLPLDARIVYQLCLLVFKALYYGEPSYLRDLLSVIPPERGLRSSDTLTLVEPLPVTGVSFIERAFQYSAPRLFNKLPRNVRKSPTVTIFKTRLNRRV